MSKENTTNQTKILCENCKYFNLTKFDWGYCRRYPPIATDQIKGTAIYPIVYENDWCGEWKKNEK